MEAPHLIDPVARNFMYNTLQKCHVNRVTLYTIALNVGVFILFIGIFGGVLYYCYKTKPSDAELQQKILRDQQYILSKIRYYQGINADRKTSDITKLPVLEKY